MPSDHGQRITTSLNACLPSPLLANVRPVHSFKAAQNKAATRIQAAQRRKAAKGAVETKRTIGALQRRKSAEIAAVSIQTVARGKAARASTAKEIAMREVTGGCYLNLHESART